MSTTAARAVVRPRLAGATLVQLGEPLAATVVYLLLTLLMAWPLVSSFGQAVPVRLDRNLENDALLNLWVLSWATHALTTNPATLFDANIFYPDPFSLAYTDHQLGVVPIFALLWALLGSPAAAFDAHYLLAFVLTGLATYAFAREWGLSWPAALFAGAAFAFAPVRLAHHYGTQLMAIYWLPLTLLCAERWLRRPCLPRALLVGLGFALQWLCSVYLGWFLTVALGIYLAAAVVGDRHLGRSGAIWRGGALAALLAALITIPALIPYWLAARYWAFSWPREHLLAHSATPLAWLSVSGANVLYGMVLRVLPKTPGVYDLFPAISPLVLALVGLIASLRGRQRDGKRRGQRWLAATFAVIGLVGLVLSFGPYVGPGGAFPTPYLLLYQWLPGFQAMRNPVRFAFLVALALAVLGGLGVDAIRSRLDVRPRRVAVSVGLLAVLGVEVFSVLPAERLPSFDRDALQELRRTADDGPIVELPVGWERGVAETPRMVASIEHWRPLVGGYSGLKPPREALETVLEEAEPAIVADALQALGVHTVVVHLDELQPDDQRRIASPAWQAAGFSEQARTARTVIWRLPERPINLAEHVDADLQLRQPPRAGQTTPARLLFQVPDGQVFRPSPGGARPVQVRWEPLEARAEPFSEELRMVLPMVIVPRPRVKVDFELRAPSQPGRYRLEVRGEHFSASETVTVGRPRD